MQQQKRKRAAAYCRVSTKSDLQDGSFETQCDYYRRRITDDPTLQFAGIYGDHGKSGRAIKGRDAFARLVRDCEAGKIDIIYTKSISRFARNLSECVAAIRKLHALGVTVCFERESIDTGSQKSELLLGILAAIAEEESISISQNIRWARYRRNEIGQPMERASYGYRAVGGNHQWVVVEAQARRVRLAFYLAGTGRQYVKIRDALNAMERAEHTGRVWNQTPLIHLLSNICYVGDYLTNKECTIADGSGTKRVKNAGYVDQFYIEGHHPPLISRELFAAVGELVQRHLLYGSKSRFTAEELSFLEKCRALAEQELGSICRKEGDIWQER